MDEERKNAQRELTSKLVETVDELERLLQGHEGPDRPAEDPRDDVFWSSLGSLESVVEAKARLLSELLELVLPTAKLLARPIRSFDKVSDPARVQALEALFGSMPTRERAAPWLDLPAVCLLGDKVPSDMSRARPEDGGIIQARELFLLMDGRLAWVESVGTWRIEDQRLLSDTTIVRACEVTPVEVMRESNLMLLLVFLRDLLRDNHPALAGQHVPELAERRERFDALVTDLGRAMEEHVVHLRRVGDSPA
ncbi:hypothetical protein ATI61_109196 [Archangium gephyra]|uniref:Uncharacterized protein n=1 Tax=Archangium gephyra TaxID=48 RepID=A0AAC8Q293_9BACT|nr:hypothetical protein [Archangium gephyra]AKI99613.1 Hypothetical protein AA314_01240 [Archangium gephyra]REG27855.1 hypothetical protein ATI61_109196 [Archangium gephyra]